MLPLLTLLEQLPLCAEVFFLEAPKTGGELGGIFHDVGSNVRFRI